MKIMLKRDHGPWIRVKSKKALEKWNNIDVYGSIKLKLQKSPY